MEDCNLFLTCSANICPLDPDKHLRNWFPGEDVCRARAMKDVPFIRRQRKINRTRPQGLEDQALTVDYLTATAPVKRILTEEQKERLRDMGKVARERLAALRNAQRSETFSA